MLKKTNPDLQHSSRSTTNISTTNDWEWESDSDFQIVPTIPTTPLNESNNGDITLFERKKRTPSVNNSSSKYSLNLQPSQVRFQNNYFSHSANNSDSDPEETSSLLQWSHQNSSSSSRMSTWNFRRNEYDVPNSLDNPNYSMASNSDGSGRDHEDGQNLNHVTHSRVRTSADHRRGNPTHRSGFLTFCASVIRCFCLCSSWVGKKVSGKREFKEREIIFGTPTAEKHVPNVIKNQKYNIITFVPFVLFEQFKFFLNLYFLLMACSQFFPELTIGYWYTYWGPLIFVLLVTMIREAADDIRRRRRDKEINNQKYTKINRGGHTTYIPSSKIKVGDVIKVEKDQRVPADMVLLRTTDKNARCFIRTDQLDGETDWKLRLPILQEETEELFDPRISIYAEKPQRDIHSFIGTLIRRDESGNADETGINVENTLWANTVLAAGSADGIVVYTGRETRSVMNNSMPRSKVGLIDLEINNLTKILFVAVLALGFLMICLKGFEGPWYLYMFRFVLLFSYMIPISLRVNLDGAKTKYSYDIQNDESIAGTVVRSSTIPEDLGRISYLLTDKTGTLTQNEMIFKRLCLATSQADSAQDVKERLIQGIKRVGHQGVGDYQRVNEVVRVTEAIKALAVCHNVTPVYEEIPSGDEETELGIEREPTLQASSPDEIALVKYASEAGLSLVRRDQTSMKLRSADAGVTLVYHILHIFPFTSEAKRMGIIVKEESSEEITFYIKGADTVMKKLVQYNDWLDEACGNMAREGLRTLVVAKKRLDKGELEDFERRYLAAKSSKIDRANQMAQVLSTLETNLELLCVTGVEDTLQKDVKVTLETLRNAGVKIWMLTGDKLETACCIAKSSKLVSTQQEIYIFKEIGDRAAAFAELNAFRRKSDAALVIKGESLDVVLQHFQKEFMELATGSPVVVVCRCSPTQKATVVQLVKKFTDKRTAAVGDGGNDVAMIQAADAGIGIEGKEGRQASLAADFSITQFSFVATLLLVHGRYSYKRSSSLAQFVMHRGLIITVMQAVFSSIFYFSSVALYQGFLMIGYATVYTMLPVFALVLDKDVKEEDLLRLPELYTELGKGRSLTLKTFLLWVLISMYQGGVIMYGSLILFQDEFIHIVSISFTTLIFTELIMVALTIRNMNYLMVVAEVISFLLYLISLVIFKDFFDPDFILSFNYVWKVALVTALSCVPIYIAKYIRRWISPPNYSKLR